MVVRICCSTCGHSEMNYDNTSLVKCNHPDEQKRNECLYHPNFAHPNWFSKEWVKEEDGTVRIL